MSRRMEVPRCPRCGRHASHVIAEDTARTVDYVRCAPCGLSARRRAVVDLAGNAWQWEPAQVWALRDNAKRVFDVLVKARQEAHGEKREVSRAAINALVASCVGRSEQAIGPWTTWSAADCQHILRRADPLIRQYADALVTGDARHLLHHATARRAAFPRVTWLWLLTRDRLRAFWRDLWARATSRSGRAAAGDV